MNEQKIKFEEFKPLEISDEEMKTLETELNQITASLKAQGKIRILNWRDTAYPKGPNLGQKTTLPYLSWEFVYEDPDKSSHPLAIYYSPKKKKLYTFGQGQEIIFKDVDSAVKHFQAEVDEVFGK